MGVQVCSGSLDISGADTKIEVTGDPVPKTENDGAIQDGAAISIVNRKGYKGLDKHPGHRWHVHREEPANAAIKAYDWQNNTAADFTASDKVSRLRRHVLQRGSSPKYCAPGFVPKANSDGTYGVTRHSSGNSSDDPTYSVSTPARPRTAACTC